MPSNAGNLRLVKYAQELPPGIYIGTWGGYIVDLRVEGEAYLLDTEQGVRTPACACEVTIPGDNGQITVKPV